MKRVVVCCVIALVLGAGPAAMGSAAAQPPSEAAMDEYVPVADLPPDEQLPAVPLVLIAYGVFWAGVLVYVGTLWRKLGAVQKEMETLKRSLRS